jgi:hypothetical protein
MRPTGNVRVHKREQGILLICAFLCAPNAAYAQWFGSPAAPFMSSIAPEGGWSIGPVDVTAKNSAAFVTAFPVSGGLFATLQPLDGSTKLPTLFGSVPLTGKLKFVFANNPNTGDNEFGLGTGVPIGPATGFANLRLGGSYKEDKLCVTASANGGFFVPLPGAAIGLAARRAVTYSVPVPPTVPVPPAGFPDDSIRNFWMNQLVPSVRLPLPKLDVPQLGRPYG